MRSRSARSERASDDADLSQCEARGCSRSANPVMGLVTFWLGLLNVPGIVMSIFVGLLLIITIALPIVARRIKQASKS